MKSLLAFSTLLLALTLSQAQERLPRQEALKYAFWLCVDLKQLLDTPIATDPDIKRPVALRDGDYGGLLLPESKLTSEMLAKADKEVVPLGQLWLVKVAPMKDGQVFPASKLRSVDIKAEQREATAFCCALGAQKNPAGTLELLVYGKGKEPLLRTPLKSVAGDKNLEAPCDISVERKDEGAELTLKLVGKYEARFMIGEAL